MSCRLLGLEMGPEHQAPVLEEKEVREIDS